MQKRWAVNSELQKTLQRGTVNTIYSYTIKGKISPISNCELQIVKLIYNTGKLNFIEKLNYLNFKEGTSDS